MLTDRKGIDPEVYHLGSSYNLTESMDSVKDSSAAILLVIGSSELCSFSAHFELGNLIEIISGQRLVSGNAWQDLFIPAAQDSEQCILSVRLSAVVISENAGLDRSTYRTK